MHLRIPIIALQCRRKVVSICKYSTSRRVLVAAGSDGSSNDDKSAKIQQNTAPSKSSLVRGDEARGAMMEFLKSAQKSKGENGVWGTIADVKPPTLGSSIVSQSPPDRGQNRVYNNRGQPKRAADKATAAPDAPAGRGSSSFSGRRAAPDRELSLPKGFRKETDELDSDDEGAKLRDDDDDNADEEVEPEIIPYLYDNPDFEEMVQKGYRFDYSEMDLADRFFADMFLESYKSKDNSVMFVTPTDDFNRVRIPKPRATRDLLQTLVPNITSIEKSSNEEAYEYAAEAHLVFSAVYS
jgi:hypothetical protein